MRIGVLAMQGAFREHCQMLEGLGVQATEVRKKSVLESLDGLIVPGGESTSMRHLLKNFSLFTTVQDFGREKPMWGICAGAILLGQTNRPAEENLGLLDCVLERNAYGRHAASFSVPVCMDLPGGDFPGIFIRAPRIRKKCAQVRTLASYEDQPVAVQQGHLLGTTFHPELTTDARVHEYFVQLCEGKHKAVLPTGS